MAVKAYSCILNGRLDIREDGSAVLYVRYPIGSNGCGMQAVRIVPKEQIPGTVERLEIDLEKPLREYP
jgi:hypothetical protein